MRWVRNFKSEIRILNSSQPNIAKTRTQDVIWLGKGEEHIARSSHIETISICRSCVCLWMKLLGSGVIFGVIWTDWMRRWLRSRNLLKIALKIWDPPNEFTWLKIRLIYFIFAHFDESAPNTANTWRQVPLWCQATNSFYLFSNPLALH